VFAFLRNDRLRGFVIEIETDSTIQPDEDAEKQRRIEFVTSVGGLFQQAAPLVMQAPMLGKFVVEVMKFAAGGFRAGRPLEAALDELSEQIEGMAEQAMQPKEPPPDPAVELKKAELDLKKQEASERLQNEERRHVERMEADERRHIEAMSVKSAEMNMKRETEQQRLADAKEGREATLKATERPAVNMNLDAEGAIGAVAEKLEGMAVQQSEAVQVAVEALQQNNSAMTEAVGALAQAIERLGQPRRKTMVGSNGKRYEMTDEAMQ
jgi:hypothetical protein